MDSYTESYLDLTNDMEKYYLLSNSKNNNQNKLWYCVYGKNTSNTPVITIHGGPGGSHDYLMPLKSLATKRKVLFYDQLGSGNSDKPDVNFLANYDRFVDELYFLIRSINLKNVILIGQSWGTAIAVGFAYKYLNIKVEKLILSSPFLCTDLWIKDAKELIKTLPEHIKEIIENAEKQNNYDTELYQNAVTEYYQKYLCRLDDYPEELNLTLSKINMDLYEYMWGPSEFTVSGTLKNFDISNKLPHLDMPVLLTIGEFDEIRQNTLFYYSSKIKNNKSFIFNNCSHEHHLENVSEYLEVIDNFIEF